VLSRREFVTAAPLLPLVLLGLSPVGMEELSRHGKKYRVDARVFFGLFTFHLEGSIDERIDRAAGRYRVVAAGQGSQISNRLESAGVIRGRRFMPTATHFFLNLRGRESRTAITYGHARGLIDYNYLGHTFFLGRRREIHDVVHPHADQQVDDVVTAALNYAEGVLQRDRSGALRIYMVWRTRREGERLLDVQPTGYRAEILPFVFRLVGNPIHGRGEAELDLSRFSPWARRGRPARIIFGPDRLPESIQADLIFGTSVRITFQPTQAPVSQTL
jgi:hypothetical protein